MALDTPEAHVTTASAVRTPRGLTGIYFPLHLQRRVQCVFPFLGARIVGFVE